MAIPLAIVVLLYFKMSLSWKLVGYATLRMVGQLIAAGFLLAIIFDAANWVSIVMVVCFMLFSAAWIARRPLADKTGLLRPMLIALAIGCLPVLLFVQIIVLKVTPWFKPQSFIPLAGMILSNGMNCLSLAADRLIVEGTKPDALRKAFETSLIPTINSFFAVGIVSLPGMMTGQILSGVSPFLAVRYQIIVMSMVLGASAISSYVYLGLVTRPLKLFTKSE